MDVKTSTGGNDLDPDECHFVRNKFVDTDYEEILKIINDLPVFCGNEDTVNLEEQRHLLDAKLNEFIAPLLNQLRNYWSVSANGQISVQLHEPAKYLWYLSKVRGPKVFIRRLPHEVDDFEPVLNLLQNNEHCSSPKWELRYVCLLWLALLCKLPFSFDLLLTASENRSITRTLFDMGREILLKYSDKSREAACAFLVELLSRSDFRYDAKSSIESCLTDLQSEFFALEDQNLKDEQKIISFLMLFCHLFKRLEKKCWNSRFVESLLQVLLSKKFESSKDILIRKLNAKLTQRIALVIIRSSFKGDSDWLYRKEAVNLNESLKSNLRIGDCVSKNNGHMKVLDTRQSLEKLQINDGDREQWSSDSVEKIVDYLSKALDDKDTIVRWSAAKGVGRITAKLPKNLADNVVKLILKIL
uniref:Tubulin-folding cofactor D ARM repeats domain-containing protein n=1 Tax=Romanomermis culicivorax TaxID=13658 RepID=A0A915JAT2_ROMCU